MHVRRAVARCLTLAWACTGCAAPADRERSAGGEPPPTAFVQLADLSHRAEAWTSAPEFTTVPIDTLQLGGGESLFARFLPDGSLLVANGPTVMRLSPEGVFDGILARSGDGPGEFRTILGLGVADDGSLILSDHESGRFTQLGPDGSVVRTIPRLRPFAAWTGMAPFAMLPDGRVLAAPWQWRAARDPDPAAAGALDRDQVAIVTYDTQGEVSDTIAVVPGLERFSGFVAPFARSAVYGGRGGGRWVAGISDSLDLMIYDGIEPRVRLVAPKVKTSLSSSQRSQRDSAVAAEFGGSVGEAVVKRQADMPRPGSPPDIGGVAVDDAGRIWIGMYVMPGERERQWYVFSDAGEALGRLMLPAFGDALLPLRTEVLDVAGGRVALIRETDEAGVFIEARRIDAFTRLAPATEGAAPPAKD